MEYIIGHYIKDVLKNNNHINVYVDDVANDYKNLDIMGYNIIAAHGHQFKNLNNVITNLSSKIGTPVDYLIIGHQHNHKVLTGNDSYTFDTEVLVSPSFMGADPFADAILKGSKAAVMIYGFHEFEGHNETYKFLLN